MRVSKYVFAGFFGALVLLLAYSNIAVTVISAEAIDNAAYDESINSIDYSGGGIPQYSIEGKGVILDFYGKWCRPCKYMDAFVLTDSTLSQYINENFVFLKVDVDDPRALDLKQKFEVRTYPTYVFLAKGSFNKPFYIHEATCSIEEFVGYCKMTKNNEVD